MSDNKKILLKLACLARVWDGSKDASSLDQNKVTEQKVRNSLEDTFYSFLPKIP